MSAGHDHASANRRNLTIVLILTSLYLVAEVVGGLLTKSLALLADAGHMLTDVGGLALALFAIRVGSKPATPERTYGYYRAEILAAMANAIVLLGISGYILYEAYERFRNPPAVASRSMLLVASFGLIINVAGVLILRGGSSKSLNMKGAYFEVVSDLLSSVAVIVAGAVMWATGWYYADPILSAGIGLFILPRTWKLLSEAVGVLLEGTPSEVNLAALREAMKSVPGVADVHDLHVWSLTSGRNAMSAHAVLAEGGNWKVALDALRRKIATEFPIAHLTIQIEPEGCADDEMHL